MPDTSLLLEIARCPVARDCLANPGRAHPCAEIVGSQAAPTIDEFQVPEPWNGPLSRAPILFLSSNPGISQIEAYPTWDQTKWPEDRLVDCFEGRFGGGRERWTYGGIHYRKKDGTFSSGKEWVRFWAMMKSIASEALGRPAIPGNDYVSTEVVHCKSSGEQGVGSALQFCADRYLHRVLALAVAPLVICLGKPAGDVVRSRYAIGIGDFHGLVAIGDQDRYVAFLQHPNHRSRAGVIKKRLAHITTDHQLQALRSFLAAAMSSHVP